MESSQPTISEAVSESEYRRQLQNSIASLGQQLNAQSTLEGKALIEDKIDQLKEQLTKAVEPKEISMQRITHLEEIFKHYCTHIFRVGKHMTFDRLDYQKVHMVMERFFKFLSDFGLTVATIDGRQREVVSKNKIITVFKKVSSTSKDLTFEEFIECLEKLGPIYHDEKESYSEKAKMENERRKKVKETVEKNKAARKALNDLKNSSAAEQPPENPDKGEQDIAEQADPEAKKADEAENDDMVRQMMENPDNIEHPVEQVNQMIKEKQEEIEKKIAENKQRGMNDGEDSEKQMESLNHNDSDKLIRRSAGTLQGGQFSMKLTTQEKVELFYKMIGVDNLKDFRNKLSELNLPLFKINHRPTPIDQQRETPQLQPPPSQSPEPKSDAEDEQAQRLQRIKQKINQKKALVRNQTQSPKKVVPGEQSDLRKQQQERRLKKQKQRQRLEKAKRLKDDDYTKKVQQGEKKKQSGYVKEKGGVVFKQSNVTWDGIEKLNFQQLNLKQFHPHNLYNLEPEDEDYMGDLKFDLKNMQKYRAMNRVREKKENDKSMRSSIAKEKRSVERIAEEKEKKVEAVVSGTKKRASQIQKSQKTKQKNMEHLSRKLSESKTPRKVKL